MANQYAELVVGGIENPRALICGPELSPNIGFEDDLTGIGGSSGATAREMDESSPFGDYVLTVEDDAAGSQEYAEITINTGAAIAGKRFILLAWARHDADEGDLNFWTNWQGLTGDHFKEFLADQIWWPHIVHEVVVPAGAAGNNLSFRIYPFAKISGNAGVGKLRIDQLQCREVFQDIELPQPTRGNEKQTWRQEFQSRFDLVVGRKVSVGKKMRYGYEGLNEKFTAAQEVLRSRLVNTADEILFFPHKDAPICYWVEWNEDFERSWAFGVAVHGHESAVSLSGTELLPMLPEIVIDELTEYTFEEGELWFEQIGDSFVYTS
jgi:hypothetical protein